MVDINGYEIKSAFSGGEPLKAIYSLGEKVWPVSGPISFGGLKFTALEDGEIGMHHYGTNATHTIPNLSYSKDGVNWTIWYYSNISVKTLNYPIIIAKTQLQSSPHFNSSATAISVTAISELQNNNQTLCNSLIDNVKKSGCRPH